MSTITQARVQVTGGVDTHKDTHTAAVVDTAGRLLGTAQFPATPTGHAALLDWLTGHGEVVLVAVEGTGAYGAGLTRFLHTCGVTVVEADRPDRKTRRWQGKSDPVDAEAAARAGLAARRTGIPKAANGQVEALRNLRVARRSAVRQRADAQRQMHTLIITAPEPLRADLRERRIDDLIKRCATSRPATDRADQPATAVMIALRSLARRHQHLTEEIEYLDALIAPLVDQINPHLTVLNGIGPDVAGQLLVTAGDNPERLHSEAAFAMLCGAAPLPASSGKTNRHRLNRGGDRQANAALHRIVICRLRWDQRTRDYTERRTKEGLTKKEIIRCLKRYVAREVYEALTNPAQPPPTTP
ncbi:IS110 family transposase [Micromonospora sp. DH14]|uniref:IS110 family transposase n=1 Tax=Micromonospora sp. DH14 TaxID=3040120 RepID=UPI002442957D|nr:IS110 family transposase [Micromonospora sp. DH14]MDG9679116.1 IS110 family transposase [Micromonospora sp. DH14]